MADRCLLGIFAHPDDEVGMAGAFRRYRDAGARTALACATRGEVGEISDPALATPATLGQVREQELREACRIMGVDDLTFLDYHDGRLADADHAEALGRVVRIIRRVQPQVIVTFDANGGYGHLDHIAIHHLATEAFRQAADPQRYPEQIAEGLAPHAAQKLYYMAFPRSRMQRLMGPLLEQQPDFKPFGDVATIPVREMGTADELVSTSIPLDERLMAVRDAAQRAHRTQQNPNSPFAHLPPEVMRELWGTMHFVRAVPQWSASEGQEQDLFAGVAV